jgi:hypothetical protein
MAVRTRARCMTERRNLSDWSTDPTVAEAASSAHHAARPMHSITIVAEQTVGLLPEASVAVRGIERKRRGMKQRGGAKRGGAAKTRRQTKGPASRRRAGTKKRGRREQ